MYQRLGKFVSQNSLAVILFWVLLTVGLKLVAPNWDDITHDGDFSFLPADSPSIVGEKMQAEAFPHNQARSHIALYIARENARLTGDDIYYGGYELARRSKNHLGVACFQRSKDLFAEADSLDKTGNLQAAVSLRQRAMKALHSARAALDEAILLDQELADYHAGQMSDDDAREQDAPERLAAAYYNRSLVLQRFQNLFELSQKPAASKSSLPNQPPLGISPVEANKTVSQLAQKDSLAEEEDYQRDAEQDFQAALAYDPSLKDRGQQLVPEGTTLLPLLDVWTWHDDVFGKKLGKEHRHVRLVILQLSNEFMATDNIRVLKKVRAELDEVRKEVSRHHIALGPDDGLQIGLSGSAAVGGDILSSSVESIKHTEMFTVILVVLILAIVFRAPLLVATPLITIAVSLSAAISIVSIMTQIGDVPGLSWLELKVFTTTKIYIVVILFGAGTDYCMFLIARYREELRREADHKKAIAQALVSVSDALTASALTTILGLGMMFFAEYEKFHYSGPVIGLCLTVTLAACMTLAPALLRCSGGMLFWPLGTADPEALSKSDVAARRCPEGGNRSEYFWRAAANMVVAYPGRILMISTLLLAPIALYGCYSVNHVTYDLLSMLGPNRPSKQGAELLRRHFPVGESGPVIVVAKRKNARFDSQPSIAEIEKLTKKLYLSGVSYVRSVSDPLGEEAQPRKKRNLFSTRALKARIAKAHQRTKDLYISQVPGAAGDVTRFELVLDCDPFSREAIETLSRVDKMLQELSQTQGSYWEGTTFAYSGVTAGIRDLRRVTKSDNLRIEILVVLAVFGVLLVILRRPLICLFMILSVLMSYYVTVGATELFFGWAYGDSFQGLDWKTPLFLFVILVAIGEDYNVYLATRVFEEQSKYGPFGGLRRGMICTGGIITSCGVIMAGTFLSMTSGVWGEFLPAWFPFYETLFSIEGGALRSIVELGFALSLGVILDTFVVRPLLVPAFMALLCRWKAAKSSKSLEDPISTNHSNPPAV